MIPGRTILKYSVITLLILICVTVLFYTVVNNHAKECISSDVQPVQSTHGKYMVMAIGEAMAGITAKDGGPFGTVIVKDGKVVGRGHNCVVSHNDPTCHGEIAAIRDACSNMGTFDLSGCVIYTTGEPCQMCLAACLWARIDKVYYGCTIDDNSRIGFRDGLLDTLFVGREKLGDYLQQIDRDECLRLFETYSSMEHTNY